MIIIGFGDELHVLILILEIQHVCLGDGQLAIWREALAVVAAADHAIATIVASLIVHVELAGRAFLAQPLAGVGVRRGLPSLRVQ